MRRSEIVAAARGWVGTPWRRQARLKGVGCDCLGLVVGVATELGLRLDIRADYGHPPDPAELRAGLAAHLKARAGQPVGAVMLFETQGVAVHLGIFTGLTVIHAHAPSGRVVETGWRSDWPGQLVAVYEFPGARN